MKVTNNKPQFQHPATPILDEILSCICPHHKPAMLLETEGSSLTLITYSGDPRDGGKIIGFKGWIISSLIALTRIIGEAKCNPSKFELYLPPNTHTVRDKTLRLNLAYDTTKVRRILATVLNLVIDGQCIIDEIKTPASITLTVQPLVPLDTELVKAMHNLLHAVAYAEGYPRLTVTLANLAKPI